MHNALLVNLTHTNPDIVILNAAVNLLKIKEELLAIGIDQCEKLFDQITIQLNEIWLSNQNKPSC